MDIKSIAQVDDQLNNEWYLFKNCSKFGPLTVNEISNLLDKNQISKDHHVWHQKYNNWVAIKDLEIFQSVGFEIQFPKKTVDFIEDKKNLKSDKNILKPKVHERMSLIKKIMVFFRF